MLFEDKTYNRIYHKIGFKGNSSKNDVGRVLIAFAVCWLPIAIVTLFQKSFWTGEITTSFITDFDIQARVFITMPILILAERSVNRRLSLIIDQFTNSGIVGSEIKEKFAGIITNSVHFLQSVWTDVAILVLCYIQTIAVIYYESTSTSILTWQVIHSVDEPTLNLAGYWSALVTVPFVIFLVYRWILRIIVWSVILYKVSRQKLTLFPFHPDLSGGLGFVGYSIRYFSPIAFAFSATVAGNVADFMLIEAVQLVDLKFLLMGYLLFIMVMFTFPLFFFSQKMSDEREKCVYENYDYINGIYRELRIKISKNHHDVGPEDLKLADFSAAADLSAVVDNALKMKYIPFTLKDLIPLVIMTAIPFLGVVLIEIPVNEILEGVMSIVL